MILLGSSGGQCECERGGRCLSICGTGTCLITFLQLLALLANFCNSATVTSKLTSSSDGERGLLQCHDMYRGGFLFSINKMNYNTGVFFKNNQSKFLTTVTSLKKLGTPKVLVNSARHPLKERKTLVFASPYFPYKAQKTKDCTNQLSNLYPLQTLADRL